MTHLLDTNHLSLLEQQAGADYAVLVMRLSVHSLSDVGVNVVSLHEQFMGCHRLVNQAKSASETIRGYRIMLRVVEQFRQFPLVPFDDAASATFNVLKSLKLRVPTMDLRIASIALARNLTLVTRNVRDFAQVPGLKMDNWTK